MAGGPARNDAREALHGRPGQGDGLVGGEAAPARDEFAGWPERWGPRVGRALAILVLIALLAGLFGVF